MLLPKEELVGRPKKIGMHKGRPVMEAAFIGGLHLVFAVKLNGGTEPLGIGSHPAVARFVAEKEYPDLEITELAKSETLPRWLVEKLADGEEAFARTRDAREIASKE